MGDCQQTLYVSYIIHISRPFRKADRFYEVAQVFYYVVQMYYQTLVIRQMPNDTIQTSVTFKILNSRYLLPIEM